MYVRANHNYRMIKIFSISLRVKCIPFNSFVNMGVKVAISECASFLRIKSSNGICFM